MKLPPLHNSRAPKQWEIISQHVDFAGKTVLDLGCGYGDILFRCWQAGADCVGIDSNEYIVRNIQEERYRIAIDGLSGDDIFNLPFFGVWPSHISSYIFLEDFREVILRWTTSPPDIIICFSVLPYLDNPTEVLGWIRKHSETALIECQYDGDGPGSRPWFVKKVSETENLYRQSPGLDKEMKRILQYVGWQSVNAIGRTLVKDRQKWRTIWLCQ